MPISGSDIVQYLSTSAGSTGGAITGSSTTSGVKNNVWSDITDASRIAGGTTYKKTFWKNNNGSFAASVPVIFTPILPTNMTLTIGLGVDSSDDADSGQGNMSAWSANALVSVVSDTAGDTRVVTIYGMNNAGTPVPTTETVVLSGTTQVLSANTYSKVWAVWVASVDAGKIVTVKQGSGGTVRGTIGLSKKICWLWVTASSKGAGIALPNLASSQSYGVWRKLSWTAGAGAVKPNSLTLRFEENA